jgi:hypothetical protein
MTKKRFDCKMIYCTTYNQGFFLANFRTRAIKRVTCEFSKEFFSEFVVKFAIFWGKTVRSHHISTLQLWRSPVQSGNLKNTTILPNVTLASLAHSSCGWLPVHLLDKIGKKKPLPITWYQVPGKRKKKKEGNYIFTSITFWFNCMTENFSELYLTDSISLYQYSCCGYNRPQVDVITDMILLRTVTWISITAQGYLLGSRSQSLVRAVTPFRCTALIFHCTLM